MSYSAEIRSPAVAGQFYAGSPAALERAVDECAAGYVPPDDLGVVLGGVVPHAGWVFSGPTAAKVFVTLAKKAEPETFVLLGAVHHWGIRAAAVFPEGAWATPLGKTPVDASLALAVKETSRGLIEASRQAHEAEHSIEVQVPFIQALCPMASIVPFIILGIGVLAL